MNANTTKGAFVLLGGILLSSVLTYILTKAYYEKNKNPKPVQAEPEKKPEKKSEVKSVKPSSKEVILQAQVSKDDITKYAEKYNRQHAELIRDYVPDPEEVPVRQIIDADIFGTNQYYDELSYTLYGDGTLVDEQNHIVEDPDNSVGIEAVERFNELEHNGAVYIRNNQTKTDFEILRDLRTYAEANGGHRARS